MTYDPFTRTGALTALTQELDPASERIELARRRYQDVGAWLKQHGMQADPEVVVYPQGSGSIGTTNQHPFTLEFDIDLVIRVTYAKAHVTQKDLNAKVNGWLRSYVRSRQSEGGDLAPISFAKGKRAFTLGYPDRFHMDALPVVPDLLEEIPASGGDPSWLTDKDLVRWQPANPKGFAGWFLDLSVDERAVFAKAAGVTIEDLPVFGGPRTNLQQAVRLLKRHRDQAFENDPRGLAPPSVVITALASYAFEKEGPSGDLAHILEVLVKVMPDFVDLIDGELVIPNPTCPSENYADRYKGNSAKRRKLLDWLKDLRLGLDELNLSARTSDLTESVDKMFGPGLGGRVAKRLGSEAQVLRSTGRLTSSAAGTLAMTQTGRRHKDHTFYGNEKE